MTILALTLLLAACNGNPAGTPKGAIPSTIETPPALTIDQAVTLAMEGHSLASEILGDAFLLEVEGKEKPPWEEVKPLLNTYWSSDILDNSFEEFYAEHLWDWGYEICLIFPLQYADAIIEYDIVSRSDNSIVLRFLVETYYDYETEELEVKIILENGSWLLG